MGKVKKTAETAKTAKKVKAKAAKVKKKSPRGDAPQKAEPAKKAKKPFSTVEVFSKPVLMAPLFEGFKQVEISAEILRPRLMTESVEHGRGRGIVRHFAFRKFKDDKPHAVFFMTTPSGVRGSFEPTDRLLKPGEQIQLSYTAEVEGADRPI